MYKIFHKGVAVNVKRKFFCHSRLHGFMNKMLVDIFNNSCAMAALI